ncbi:MAG TPA: hypothetical protein ENG03_08855 [Thioploca sp.]|nr:hypothetical protein [Thioploca sp.]
MSVWIEINNYLDNVTLSGAQGEPGTKKRCDLSGVQGEPGTKKRCDLSGVQGEPCTYEKTV